ncbi:unnamed protein product [Scytosiphon promiscuus]
MCFPLTCRALILLPPPPQVVVFCDLIFVHICKVVCCQIFVYTRDAKPLPLVGAAAGGFCWSVETTTSCNSDVKFSQCLRQYLEKSKRGLPPCFSQGRGAESMAVSHHLLCVLLCLLRPTSDLIVSVRFCEEKAKSGVGDVRVAVREQRNEGTLLGTS